MKRAVITGGSGVVGSALIRELAISGVELLVLLREGSKNNQRVRDLTEDLRNTHGAKIDIRECSLEHLKDFCLGEEKNNSDDREDISEKINDSDCSGERNDCADRSDISDISDISADTLESVEETKESLNSHVKPNCHLSPNYDVFYHLSWGGTKGKERFDPYIHNKNVEYALDAAALAKRLGCTAFVGTGSQAEYGRCDEKLTEKTVPQPENAYGIAKLCAGHMTREYARQLGLRHVWTRILSVYGPNDGEKTLVTYLVNSFLEGVRPISTAGEQVWDYLYSEDAARALHSVGDRGRDGQTYLIASGQERLLKDYILEIRDILAPGAEVGLGEVPYGERQVMHLSADISRIMEDTGWKPEISFSEGIKRMADVMRTKR